MADSGLVQGFFDYMFEEMALFDAACTLTRDRLEKLDLPRFRGEVRSWDQGIWFDGILSSSFE